MIATGVIFIILTVSASYSDGQDVATTTTRSCPPGEVLKCPKCEPTCAEAMVACPMIFCEPASSMGGCVCEGELVRSPNGTCVNRSDCPQPKCGENEEFVDSDCTSCDGTCENPEPICAAVCGPPKCMCEEDYVRDENKKCVHVTQCKQRKPRREWMVNPPYGSPNGCAAFDCLPGYVCVLHQVWCIRAPCPPLPQCVPVTSNPCAAVRCMSGYSCVISGNRPQCIPIQRQNPPAGYNPCADKRCELGQKCIVTNVQCFTEPCPPIAECVPITPPVNSPTNESDACDDFHCDPGYECVLNPVVCIQAPCPPLPECQLITNTTPSAVANESQSVQGHKEDPCAVVRCMEGFRCVAKGNRAECVPFRGRRHPRPVTSCATVLCIEGTKCVQKGNKVKCVPEKTK